MNILFLLLISTFSHAGTLTCLVNGYYPRAYLSWDEKTVKMEVNSPRGFNSLPQIEAPFSAENIPMLEMQSEALKDLGDSFTYTWPKEKCEFSKDDAMLISCFGGSTEKKEGIRAMSFTTSRIDEKSLSGENHLLRLRFIFEKKNLYFVAMPFPLNSCHRKE